MLNEEKMWKKKKRSQGEELVSDAVLVSGREKQQFYEELDKIFESD